MKCAMRAVGTALFAAGAADAVLLLRRSAGRAEKLASLALDRQLQLAAASMPDGPTKDMLLDLHLCAPCEKYERFGEAHDGGYVMCTDGLDKGIVAAYSWGISGYDGWGTAVSEKYHIPVQEYDCTNLKAPVGGDLHFHGECVKSQSGREEAPRFKTMSQQIAEAGNGEAANGTLLMKMDIEGAEWNILAEESPSTLAKFKEIVLEFHWLDKVDQHPLYARALHSLATAGFVPTHLHGNNYGGMAVFGEYSVPNVLEVTYVPKGPTACAAVPYRLALDSPNNANNVELPDADLP